ncbi:MAG: homoserine kinase [Anaerosomatales bacterium]|nr:homoserine kinase [Anaerosomatales bacterium]
MPRVRVPATSANLGPGYDAFGLALALYNEFTAEPARDWSVSVEGEGAGELREDAGNQVVMAMRRAFAEAGVVTAARVRCVNAIPVGRGLGSSSAAVVGGLMLGNAIAGGGLTPQRLLELATELEGHPDNAAAALLGGFVVSWADDTQRAVRIEPTGGVAAVIAVGDTALPTATARAVLPAEVPHADAAFNVGRAALLAVGLATGDATLVRPGLEDRIHERFRAAVIGDLAEVRAALVDAGAEGAVLSGAGPSVVGIVLDADDGAALARARSVAERAERTLARSRGRSRVLAAGIDRTGARVTDS